MLPHCGVSNKKLRAHLALFGCEPSIRMRVDNETRSWEDGKVLVFDDSFEHEIWHHGSASRAIIILDVFHPDLDRAGRQFVLTNPGEAADGPGAR